MNLHDEDALAQRLTGLTLTTPPTLIPRVLNAAPEPARRRGARRPRWATAVIAMLVLLGGLSAATYGAPRFQQALADTPVVGSAIRPLLDGIGLEPLAGHFQSVQSVSTSGGYRLELVAAYADRNETYLALRMTPATPVFPTGAQLTDQFGRTLDLKGGTSLADGRLLINFAGVSWPDDVVGARLTLHIQQLDIESAQGGTIRGNWTMDATIDVQGVRPYRHPLPSDAHLDSSVIRFTEVQATPATLRVRMHISEPLSKKLGDAVGADVPGVSKPHLAFTTHLLGSDGTEVQPISGETTELLSGADLTATWLRPAAGTYRLVVSYEGIGQVEREVYLP